MTEHATPLTPHHGYSYSRVFKYPLDPRSDTMALPRGAKVLSVGLDPAGVPSLWALVRADPDDLVPHLVRCICTGERFVHLQHWEEFIGTVQSNGIVLHVFWGEYTNLRPDLLTRG